MGDPTQRTPPRGPLLRMVAFGCVRLSLVKSNLDILRYI